MNLLELQNKARCMKWDKDNIGSNNVLGINNKLNGTKNISNTIKNNNALVLDSQEIVIPKPAIKKQKNTIKLALINNLAYGKDSDDLDIVLDNSRAYRIVNALSKVYGVCHESIVQAILEDDITISNTSFGYQAKLNK